MTIGLALALGAGLIAAGLQHTVGVAPILAALLCAACFLRLRDVVVIGVLGMLLRELIVGFSWFTLVRLVGVLSVVGVIVALRVRPTAASLLRGLAVSAPAYHLTLAVGDWMTHTCTQEPWTPSGLLATLTSTLPYVWRSVLGDALFAGVFLGLYAAAGSLVRLRWPSSLRGGGAAAPRLRS